MGYLISIYATLLPPSRESRRARSPPTGHQPRSARRRRPVVSGSRLRRCSPPLTTCRSSVGLATCSQVRGAPSTLGRQDRPVSTTPPTTGMRVPVTSPPIHLMRPHPRSHRRLPSAFRQPCSHRPDKRPCSLLVALWPPRRHRSPRRNTRLGRRSPKRQPPDRTRPCRIRAARCCARAAWRVRRCRERQRRCQRPMPGLWRLSGTTRDFCSRCRRRRCRRAAAVAVRRAPLREHSRTRLVRALRWRMAPRPPPPPPRRCRTTRSGGASPTSTARCADAAKDARTRDRTAAHAPLSRRGRRSPSAAPLPRSLRLSRKSSAATTLGLSPPPPRRGWHGGPRRRSRRTSCRCRKPS